MTIRIYRNPELEKQGLPWALHFTAGKGFEINTASGIEVFVPSWTEIDHTSRLGTKYFWTCRGELHWVGTKAIITGECHENDQKNQSQESHQNEKPQAA